MTVTLYEATVPSFLRQVGAIKGVLEKGAAHFKEAGIDADALIEERLINDMAPLRFQVECIHHHSANAIAQASTGKAGPPSGYELPDYASLQALIDRTLGELQAIKPDDVNAIVGKDVVFELGEFKLPFIAENFLFSFSLPNFFFHTTTAYDLLRLKGVQIGKRDFLGQLAVKGA